MSSVEELVIAMHSGDRNALTRLISLVEEGAPESAEILWEASPHGGRSYRIGFTGPPGSGSPVL